MILAGDEAGVAAAARHWERSMQPELDRNQYGTPLVSGALRIAKERAGDGAVCFVNTDILLPPSLAGATRLVRDHADSYLIIGECRDAPSRRARSIRTPSTGLRCGGSSRRRGADAIDYFVFTPDLFDDVPAFAVGRPAWDNWLIWRAREAGAVVVDASAVVEAIHQSHDYDHLGGREARWTGPEVAENRRLAGGGRRRLYSRLDATHRLTRARARTEPARDRPGRRDDTACVGEGGVHAGLAASDDQGRLHRGGADLLARPRIST